MPNADTSKLEAVNTMLALVGEDAVNSLDTNVSADVALAIRTLEEQNRQVQVRGWHWNTENEATITADGNSRFPWQTDWIRVDTDKYRYSDVDLVRRGSFLFNVARKKNTNVIARTTMLVDIVRYLDWTAMPESARQAIMIKAARIFTNRVMGDDLRSGYAKLDEDEAMQVLIDADNEQADYNYESLGAPAEAHRDGRSHFNLPAF
jgi:hypothetical protein